jgi:hypothetical protein
MRPIFTTPDATTRTVLEGATFADAFTLDINGPAIDARTAAERAFASSPRWITRLLTVRNAIVKPLGLKGTSDPRIKSTNRVGFFPCISQTPERIVMGLDDTHLDFRIIVDVAAIANNRQRITATTVVKPHNLLGRAYLTTIMPFHKLIVPTMLARVAHP